MYNRLLEADDIIHELTRLVDISRNKQLQKKLLQFADASLQMINEQQEINMNKTYGAEETAGDTSESFNRQQPNIRIRDSKPKKSKKDAGPGPASLLKSSNFQQPGKMKRDSSQKKSNEKFISNAFANLNSKYPPKEDDYQAKPKKKKKREFKENEMTMSNAGGPPTNYLQNVEGFKQFLLHNDSQFSDYLNSELLKQTFDTHMMKEGMITFMA